MSEILAKRYVLTNHIGQGGMADVYVALDLILNRKVAVKILRGELSVDPVALLRFQREAMASTSLSHPNIVDIYDVGEDNGKHFIVMEYIEGYTLKQLIAKRGAMQTREVVNIMKQLVSAICEAHKRGVIHRDIKPQNILVKPDGTLKIVDFGIAFAQGALQLTQSDSVMGSVHYLAPELAKGESASEQSDLYSLGIVMYELLTGKVPFNADSAVQIALQHMHSEVPSVKEINPDILQSVENIIIKATYRDKNYRYLSGELLLADLEVCLSSEHANDSKLILAKDLTNKTMKIEKIKDVDGKTIVKKKIVKKKHKKNKVLTGVLWSLIVLLLTVVIVALLFLGGFFKPKIKVVAVPDLYNLTVTEAKNECQELELTLDTGNITYELTTNTEKGKIIKVTPEIGTEIEKGSKVSIVVSSGVGTTMKDYVGLNIKDVEEELKKFSNMHVTKVEVEKDDVASGTIITQDGLTAGTMFNPELSTTVKFSYVKYPKLVIPVSLKNMPVEEAKAKLEELGADVILSTLPTDDLSEEEIANLPKGVVISTTPNMGVSYSQEEGNYIIIYYY